jgi:hypothetical protein
MEKILCLVGIVLVSVLVMAEEKKAEGSLADVRWGKVVNDQPFDKATLPGNVVVVAK